jgi:SAM-dependent methyltransferase
MMRGLLRTQTLASFDYQWKELPEGEALVSDDWFVQNVPRIISEELLCLRSDWFHGKRVLDAGCGLGRWTVGLLRLGCEVLATDFSEHALERTSENVNSLCTREEAARLTLEAADLLELPAEFARERFDVVFSFGVLHHTGDTHRALANVAELAGPDGALFIYLYGKRSLSSRDRASLAVQRFVLAPLPFTLKRRAIGFLRPGVDLHQVFDLLSPTINTRHTFEEVQQWLRAVGFQDIVRTIDHSELFVRALRTPEHFAPFLIPLPGRPYWFERYD